jgi:hypothetical protein
MAITVIHRMAMAVVETDRAIDRDRFDFPTREQTNKGDPSKRVAFVFFLMGRVWKIKALRRFVCEGSGRDSPLPPRFHQEPVIQLKKSKRYAT